MSNQTGFTADKTKKAIEALEKENAQLQELIEKEKEASKDGMTQDEYDALYQEAESLNVVSTPHNTEHTKYENADNFGLMGGILIAVSIFCVILLLRALKKFKAAKREFKTRTEGIQAAYDKRFKDAYNSVPTDDAYVTEIQELSDSEKEIEELEKKLGIK